MLKFKQLQIIIARIKKILILCIAHKTSIAHLQRLYSIVFPIFSHASPLRARGQFNVRRRPRCKPLNYGMASRTEGQLQATTLRHDSPPGFRPPFHVRCFRTTSFFFFFFIFKQFEVNYLRIRDARKNIP